MSDIQAAAPAATPSTDTTTPDSTVGDAANAVANEASPTEEGSAGEASAEQNAELQKEVERQLKKWQLKSNGKTREVTDEDELVRLAQLGLGANEKFEAAAKTRKQAEQVLELLQSDPKEALKRLGFDVRKFAEDYLYEEIQAEKLTPEQKKVKEMEVELEKYKREKADLEQKQREEHISRLQQQYEVDLQDKIINAIDKYKLPNNPRTVARVAEYMAKALENGYLADPLEVAPRVRADLEEEHRSLYSQYNVEDLLKLIGEDKAKAIRQYEVQKVKAKAPNNPVQTTQVAQPQKQDEDSRPKKQQTFAEMLKDIESEYK
jgi:hypothetical protein